MDGPAPKCGRLPRERSGRGRLHGRLEDAHEALHGRDRVGRDEDLDLVSLQRIADLELAVDEVVGHGPPARATHEQSTTGVPGTPEREADATSDAGAAVRDERGVEAAGAGLNASAGAHETHEERAHLVGTHHGAVTALDHPDLVEEDRGTEEVLGGRRANFFVGAEVGVLGVVGDAVHESFALVCRAPQTTADRFTDHARDEGVIGIVETSDDRDGHGAVFGGALTIEWIENELEIPLAERRSVLDEDARARGASERLGLEDVSDLRGDLRPSRMILRWTEHVPLRVPHGQRDGVTDADTSGFDLILRHRTSPLPVSGRCGYHSQDL